MSDWAIIAARLLQFASALVLSGSSLFYLYGYTPAPSSGRWGWPRIGLLVSAATALIGVAWWVTTQAAIFFPDAGAFDPNANWILLTETRFGRICLIRAGLLAISIVATLALSPARTLWVVQSILGAAVVASFAWTGHGVYDSGWSGALHTASDVLHLLAAGVWIGALVPLAVLIARSLRTKTESDARTALNGLGRFSGIGPAVVAVLVLTGLVNSWFLVGIAQWQALFTSTYGITLAIKLGLFGGMLLLAAVNRYRLTPKLRSGIEQGVPPFRVLQSFRTSVLTETGLGMVIVTAVAVLGTLEPPVAGN